MAEYAPLGTNYERRDPVGERWARSIRRSNSSAYCWRNPQVGLYAELRTPVPVSVKRLQKQMERHPQWLKSCWRWRELFVSLRCGRVWLYVLTSALLCALVAHHRAGGVDWAGWPSNCSRCRR